MTTVQSRKRNDLKGFIRKSIYKHCQGPKVQFLIFLLSHQYQHHHHKVGPQKRFFPFSALPPYNMWGYVENQKFHPKLLCNIDSVNFNTSLSGKRECKMQLQFGVNHFGNAKKMSSFLPKIFVTCSQIFIVFSCLSWDQSRYFLFAELDHNNRLRKALKKMVKIRKES